MTRRLNVFSRSFLLILAGVCLSVQTPQSKEYQIKAVFLFNFAQFVEWPSSAFQSSQAPMVIGILGEDPFGNYLTETILNEKLNGHPLTIQHFKNVDEIKTCHILYINPSRTDKLEKILPALKNRSILTVSDDFNFTKQGGMVRFLTENNKIRLQINLEASKAADLTISSKLLRLAEIVTSKN